MRTLAGAAGVVAAAIFSMLAARGLHKPFGAAVPAYRQKGPPEASVVIEEFSDFQCPACRYAEDPLKKLLELHAGKARFLYKHFPLEHAHPWARRAATAAECAGRQDKFWPVHDAIYEKQAAWSAAKDPAAALDELAAKAGVDKKVYQACVEDPAIKGLIDADVAEGDNRFVGSTPTFFINGRRFAGAKQLQVRGTTWIEKLLKARP